MGLLTLEEWNILAMEGEVTEPVKQKGKPSTGIGCPEIDPLTGRVCGAHLWDGKRLAAAKMVRVQCKVCGFEWFRLMGVKTNS